MARYTAAVCKQCRREGQKLFLKGEKCYSAKCPYTHREYAPGQHGQGRKKSSEYGIQLRAKQKTRRYYGVLESQFRKYFEMAARQQGMTGENFLKILESRLDNVVYRLGLAHSRAMARQLVRHGHFTVNGIKTDIPSFLVKEGDVVAVTENTSKNDNLKAVFEANSARPVPMWLDADKTNMTAKVIRMPERDEIDLDVAVNLIVELYSK